MPPIDGAVQEIDGQDELDGDFEIVVSEETEAPESEKAGRLKDFKANRDTERKGSSDFDVAERRRLETELNEARAVAQHWYGTARSEAEKARKQVSTLTRSQAESEQKEAKAAYLSAYNEGDAEAMADASVRLAAATSRLGTIGPEEAEPPAREPVYQPAQQPAQQPIRLTDAQRNWVSAHPWFGQPGHEEITSAAYGVADNLKGNGVQEGSDEFFSTITDRLAKRFPEYFDGAPEKGNRGAPRPPVAGGSHGTSKTRGKTRVVLTPRQVAFAKRNGILLQDMAAEVQRLAQEKEA